MSEHQAILLIGSAFFFGIFVEQVIHHFGRRKCPRCRKRGNVLVHSCDGCDVRYM